MPRKKKDGRFINYYIDRSIYERLERYAEDRSQPMTTALERILDEHLSHCEAELAATQRYCPAVTFWCGITAVQSVTGAP